MTLKVIKFLTSTTRIHIERRFVIPTVIYLMSLVASNGCMENKERIQYNTVRRQVFTYL
jgi:hypothetical protein